MNTEHSTHRLATHRMEQRMKATPRVVFRDLPESEMVQAECNELARDLETLHPRIRSCDVVVAPARERDLADTGYEVRILLIVPHGEIAVRRAPASGADDLRRAVGEAFHAAGQRLARFIEHDGGPLAGRLGPHTAFGFGAV